MEMIPKVLQAVAGQNRLIYIYFHDGTVLNDTVPGIWMGTATLPPAVTWTPVNYMSPATWWKIP